MSEPLNIPYQLEHYLNFISDNTGMVQIDEPIGFDAANFVIQQDKNRYGRDISFAGEESDFTFVSQIAKYGHQFDKLIEYDKIYGFESEVEYLLKDSENDEYYLVGTIDFKNKQTDQIKEFSCKFIQSTSQAILKRRNDVKVDLFSDTDLDGEPITPVSTSGILLKAKPIIQTSNWNVSTPFWAYTYSGTTNILYQNPLNILNAGAAIENSLSYIDRFIYTLIDNLEDDYYNFSYVDAVNDLTDISLTLTGVKMSYFIPVGASFSSGWQTTPDRIFIQGNAFEIGNTSFAASENVLFQDFYNPNTNTNPNRTEYQLEFIGTESVERFDGFTGNADRYDVTLPDIVIPVDPIVRGKRLSILFNVGRYFSIVEWLSGSLKIIVTSTAIDSVTNGVRLIDAINQNAKSINQDFTVDAPRFENGGEWYDNFVFDGNLIRGRTSPFIFSWKAIENALQEFNSDYEVNNNTVFVGKYDDFYTNNDIGAFLIAPDDTFRTSYNERYAVNRFNFSYKTFNQDKDDDNTIDGVHTETEWLNKNTQVENYKEIDIDFIRDPFMLETTRKKSVSTKPTTSLSQDDKVFIEDIVPIAPSTRGGFSASITHFVNSDGDLQLLNDSTYNWSLLGFGVGDEFTIETTTNAGTYTVTELTNNIITLTPVVASPTDIGQKITRVSYPLTLVQYTIRTNEGFDRIENIDSPDKFSNLLYTPKRNILNNWGSYLKTCTKYKPFDIINTYFKNGGALLTQFNGGDVITENATITQAELSDMLVTPEIITTKVITDFSGFKDFSDLLKSTRGFIRVYDNNLAVRKLFPQKVDYVWSRNEMEITGEVKWESEYTTIIKSNGIYVINEVGYPEDILPELEYQTENNNIQFFDSVTRPLTNSTRYDYVSVNGVVYDTIIELAAAIEAL